MGWIQPFQGRGPWEACTRVGRGNTERANPSLSDFHPFRMEAAIFREAYTPPKGGPEYGGNFDAVGTQQLTDRVS